LPPEKQYLVTRRVPCRHRPKELERQATSADEELVDEGGDEEWVATHIDRTRHTNIVDAVHIPDIDMDVDGDEEMRDMDIDDIPGLEDMQMPSDDDSDYETTNNMYSYGQHISLCRKRTVRTRTYDLFITYDKYWRCPRLWLFGYTALGAPLPVTAIMEDISTDYVDKTVTVETWPYMEGQGMSMASVHPCKHSAVMQSIIARQSERGDEVRVDQYSSALRCELTLDT
jgi:ubiquitin-like-conjugating enzyme ATG3